MTTAHEAEEARDALEARLAKPVAALVDEFTRDVLALADEAHGEGGGDVLLAGLRRPFTLGAVLGQWSGGVERTIGAVQRSLPSALATPAMMQDMRARLLAYPFPSRLFESTKQLLLESARLGWTRATTMSKIKDVIRSQYPDAVAGIVRTEATRLYNHAAQAAAAQRGYAKKEWVAVMDDRTRASHAEAHGQQVPINEAFDIGGWAMMYPGDAAGPPEEVYNCRCVLIEAGGNPTDALYEVPE